MSETLRCELAPLNVRVITVVAGYVHTNIFDNASPPELPPQSLYHAAEAGIVHMS